MGVEGFVERQAAGEFLTPTVDALAFYMAVVGAKVLIQMGRTIPESGHGEQDTSVDETGLAAS